jgi:hypothetical protein
MASSFLAADDSGRRREGILDTPGLAPHVGGYGVPATADNSPVSELIGIAVPERELPTEFPRFIVSFTPAFRRSGKCSSAAQMRVR